MTDRMHLAVSQSFKLRLIFSRGSERRFIAASSFEDHLNTYRALCEASRFSQPTAYTYPALLVLDVSVLRQSKRVWSRCPLLLETSGRDDLKFRAKGFAYRFCNIKERAMTIEEQRAEITSQITYYQRELEHNKPQIEGFFGVGQSAQRLLLRLIAVLQDELSNLPPVPMPALASSPLPDVLTAVGQSH